MPEPTTSQIVWQYVLVVLAYWWTLLPVVAMPAIDAWNWHRPETKKVKVPPWIRLAISLGCLMIAQFLAYRNSIKNLSAVIEEKRQQSIAINSLREEVQNQGEELKGARQTISTLKEKLALRTAAPK